MHSYASAVRHPVSDHTNEAIKEGERAAPASIASDNEDISISTEARSQASDAAQLARSPPSSGTAPAVEGNGILSTQHLHSYASIVRHTTAEHESKAEEGETASNGNTTSLASIPSNTLALSKPDAEETLRDSNKANEVW